MMLGAGSAGIDVADRLRRATRKAAVAGWPTFNEHIGLTDVIGKIDATILIWLYTVGGAGPPDSRERARMAAAAGGAFLFKACGHLLAGRAVNAFVSHLLLPLAQKEVLFRQRLKAPPLSALPRT